MCDKSVFKDSFMLKYCHDRYKTQELCDKNVDDFLPAFKFLPDWFVTRKLIETLQRVLFADDDILLFVEDSGNVTITSNKMGILSVDVNNINLDDVNFD